MGTRRNSGELSLRRFQAGAEGRRQVDLSEFLDEVEAVLAEKGLP